VLRSRQKREPYYGDSQRRILDNTPGEVRSEFKMQRIRRECGTARQELLLKAIVFEEMPVIQPVSCRPYSSKPNVRRTRSGSKPAFFAASMTVARSFAMGIG